VDIHCVNATNNSGVVENGNFSVLLLAISSEALELRPTLLYSRPNIQSLVAFTMTPNYVTLSDRERLFTRVTLC